MRLTISLIIAMSAANFALAQVPTLPAGTTIRHIAGLDAVKRNATGTLTLQGGTLEFKSAKGDDKVPVSAIEDIFIGTETTQSGTKTGKTVRIAAMAAPYESGRALTLVTRTKVDVLTVSYHDADGGLHGAIFALPLGQAETMRASLIQAGAHTSPVEKQLGDRTAQ